MICEEKGIHHLPVKDEAGKMSGMIEVNDLYKSLINSLSFHITQVNQSETVDQLKQCNKRMQLHVKSLIRSEMSVWYITKMTSSFSDAVIRKVIELTILDIGQPPVAFSFICLGSEGRKEETLYTDQDNAIIYEDVPKDQDAQVNEYFIKLGEKVGYALNHIGYSFCQGNIMAKNPKWCQPYSVWERYFANWITSPEPQNLLDATIFFDFRTIYGDETFTEKLQHTIGILIKNNPLFLYHLAYNTYYTKPQQLSSANIISEKNADLIDLKSAISLIVMFTRTYCLQNGIWNTNTFERLNALKAANIISANSTDELIYAYNFLMKLRLKNQAELSDNQAPLSNMLNARKLIEIESSILKKVLSLLPVFQSKISTDFRIKT